jgi:hypothetical protein
MFREVKLELKVVSKLRHPSIVEFLGAAARFPKAGQNIKDWYSDWCTLAGRVCRRSILCCRRGGSKRTSHTTKIHACVCAMTGQWDWCSRFARADS